MVKSMKISDRAQAIAYCIEEMINPPASEQSVIQPVLIPFSNINDHVRLDPFSVEDVKELIYGWGGCYCEARGDSPCDSFCDGEYHAIGELHDGRFFYVVAEHDTSGWG